MALMNINTQLIKIDKEVKEEYLFYERKKNSRSHIFANAEFVVN
jgi:hypothetical protein